MTARHVEGMLWALALALALMAGTRARFEGGRVDEPLWTVAPPTMQRTTSEALAAAARVIVERDVFRLERRPSSVAYAPATADLPPQSPRPPKPALVVTGIVGGPPWEALVDGIPGRAGSVVVRRGDVFGDSAARLTVKRVGRDTVVVVGMDTTWTLTVRKAWQ